MALLVVNGVIVNGPYSLMTTAISADLGNHRSLKGNSRALATVSAIIDGTGSIGAAVGPFLAGLLVWNDTFYLLMGSVFISALVRSQPPPYPPSRAAVPDAPDAEGDQDAVPPRTVRGPAAAAHLTALQRRARGAAGGLLRGGVVICVGMKPPQRNLLMRDACHCDVACRPRAVPEGVAVSPAVQSHAAESSFAKSCAPR